MRNKQAKLLRKYANLKGWSRKQYSLIKKYFKSLSLQDRSNLSKKVKEELK